MQRRRSTLLAICILAIFAAGCEDPYASAPGGPGRQSSPPPARRSSDDWQVYTSQEGRFSVLLPVGWETDDAYATVATRNVRINGVKATSPSGTLYRVVTYHTNAAESEQELTKILDSSCNNKDKIYGLLSKSTISFGPYQGRETTFNERLGDGLLYFVRDRLYGMKDRQINVSAYTPPGKQEGEEVARFFDSFKILEPVE